MPSCKKYSIIAQFDSLNGFKSRIGPLCFFLFPTEHKCSYMFLQKMSQSYLLYLKFKVIFVKGKLFTFNGPSQSFNICKMTSNCIKYYAISIYKQYDDKTHSIYDFILKVHSNDSTKLRINKLILVFNKKGFFILCLFLGK